MPSDNIRPRGRCCDCRWLSIDPKQEAVCEAPLAAAFQGLVPIEMDAAFVVAVRSCDCYEKREATNG